MADSAIYKDFTSFTKLPSISIRTSTAEAADPFYARASIQARIEFTG